MKLSDVPFRKSDIANFLPTLTNSNTQIGKLVGDTGSGSILNSLFPKYGAGDTDGAELAQNLFKQYEHQLLNNVSWDVSLHYTSTADHDIARNYANAAQNFKLGVDSLSAMLPPDNSAGTVSSASPGTHGSPGTISFDSKSDYRGLMSSVIQSLTGATPTDVSITNPSYNNTEASTPFNWKSRSNEICGQIKARGYNPYDFGCLERPDEMNRESFSWRGYARMVCNRLSTIYDPSVPTLCGCPPPTWPGWRQ
jgi:hypothetical protein